MTTSSIASTASKRETTTSSPSITMTFSKLNTTSSIPGRLTHMTNTSSLLATSDSGTRDVNRTALISGVTTAAVDLAALALGAIFICKCTQKRSISFMGTIKCIRVKSKGYRDLPNMPVRLPLLHNLQITLSLGSTVLPLGVYFVYRSGRHPVNRVGILVLVFHPCGHCSGAITKKASRKCLGDPSECGS
ncbi:hypothetical protein IW261DRAFT_1011633 [Armillaria novae-zelandiae]|uniref:Uncharacterized protein n=1 Tax=Armillaria novae-zelandiae TaxID=153914 RepID=A0AA39NND5_9AGAR|nr:hypothetical protein IW261DRAFT_1011633 [Armillaria novae-zelandiae]